MVSCKSCKKKDKREYADDCFACDKGDQWEAKRHRSPNKPKTNADRIRSMTDEELAEWASIREMCFIYHLLINDPDLRNKCRIYENCKDCWLDWLKEECE